ncbi:MAG: hypothetical protein CBC55_04960 [Gammaproteobacteria bacterium TMED95]|nr:MAG: hypothetical protein CBC55_04960 [Gammaproteobacteria bacterium TMED95]|tara:strand:+ start:4920 stop:5159 length:240 start_codon:yes stop_codon:yes gene_type:complete
MKSKSRIPIQHVEGKSQVIPLEPAAKENQRFYDKLASVSTSNGKKQPQQPLKTWLKNSNITIRNNVLSVNDEKRYGELI